MHGLWTAVAFTALSSITAQAGASTLRFKALPIEVGANPTLGDIADVDAPRALADQLKAVALGQAPMPGHRATISSRELLDWVRSERPELADAIQWEGVTSVTVLRPGIELPLAQLTTAAEASLDAWLRDRYPTYEARPIAASARTLKMSREATIDMLVQGSSAAKRMAVWATIHEPGLPDRALPLWFSVSATAPAWVAVREIPAGAEIDDAAIALQSVDLTDCPGAIPANYSLFSDKQSVTPIAIGRVLTSRMLVDRPLVVAGDRVKLKATEGSVSIETVGIAEQSGGKGQHVRVRNAHSGDALSARVVAADSVEAMP